MDQIKEKPKGGIIAAFLGAIVSILSIGIFHLIGHAHKGFKTFLTLDSGVGPLSGKVIFAYALGIIVFIIFHPILKKKKNINLVLWISLLLVALLLGTLFTYTPFVEWVA